MNWLDYIGVPLIARLFLVVLFPFSTLDKIFDYKNALKQARSSFLPGGRALLVVGSIVEVVGSICIVCYWHDRLAAFILAGYCIVTAFLFHQFWAQGDFWSAKETSKGRAHFWDFLKNFGLAGGLLMVMLTGSTLPVSIVIAHPLSSTQQVAQP
jgi:putative oxidoreductase